MTFLLNLLKVKLTKKQNETDVCEAFKHLILTIIPQFCITLNIEARKFVEINSESLDLVITFKEGPKLVQDMHKVGMNVRLMGLCLKYFPIAVCGSSSHPVSLVQKANSLVRDRLLVEMLARVIKADIREALRSQMIDSRIASLQPYKRCVVQRLNLVFGFGRNARLYWGRKLLRLITTHFPDSACDTSGNVVIFQDLVNKRALFFRLTSMVMIEFSELL